MVPTLWKASRLVSLSRRVRNTSPRFVDLSWPNRVKRCGILQWRTLNPTTAYPPYPIMLNSACNEWHRILSIYFIYISVYITICIYTYRISLYWYTYSRLFLYAYCIHTYIRVSIRDISHGFERQLRATNYTCLIHLDPWVKRKISKMSRKWFYFPTTIMPFSIFDFKFKTMLLRSSLCFSLPRLSWISRSSKAFLLHEI